MAMAENAIPQPTPAKWYADKPGLPASLSRSRIKVEENTRTNALAIPPAKRSKANAVSAVVSAMAAVVAAAERQGAEEPSAVTARQEPQRSGERTHQIAEKVGRRDQSRPGMIKRNRLRHERQDGRVDKPANAHGRGEPE